ncbi:hypothetical protein SODALDRAFT_324637 [Sodiomyces alkalinus F11]|uniref:Uncharacterized protein n=1 Tax=Sodiomyces alkalinus (strain CBS 110278 / VKM F-3762 / F11) TaxID=1314773 RepID=A0A3N2PUQ0_SODAK|nr:hypothetical protein SODALDRAFT_324637 [Sodiomyces alkalinus F11]ROT38237.1 hypothetical protein SODALDRAFT_324637 [Sodiomyces alkalinus F11]
MSNNQTERLGVSCPEGGQFYVCAGKETEFLGCCTSDPCTDSADGHCPIRDLRPASFDPDRYANIPRQSCDDARSHRIWWTCRTNDPPFLGCCASDPCGEGCPSDHLVQAVLSEDEDSRLPFVPEEATTSSPTSSPTASPSPSDEPSDPSGSSGLPTGAIVGIAIGGALALLLLAFVAWKSYRKARKDNDQSLRPEMGFAHAGPRHSDLSTASTIPYSNHSTPTTAEFAKCHHNGYHAIQPSSPAAAAAHPHRPPSPGYTDSENGLLSGQPSPHFPRGHVRTVSDMSQGSATSVGVGSHVGGRGHVVSEIDGVEKPRIPPGVPEILINDVETERPRVALQPPIAELPAEEIRF